MNIVSFVKLKGFMLDGHVACTGKMKNTYEILSRKTYEEDIVIDMMAMRMWIL